MKINELLDAHAKPPKGKSVSSLINDVFRSSMKGPPIQEEDVPMMVLRHRWLRGRNLVVGATVISFDIKGIARVPDLAHARLDCISLVRISRGLVEFVEGDEALAAVAAAEVAPAPSVAAPAKAQEPPKEEPKPAETYNVILKVVGNNEVALVRAVRDIAAVDIAQAKALVSKTPVLIKSGLSEAAAQQVAKTLQDAGGGIGIEPEKKKVPPVRKPQPGKGKKRE